MSYNTFSFCVCECGWEDSWVGESGCVRKERGVADRIFITQRQCTAAAVSSCHLSNAEGCESCETAVLNNMKWASLTWRKKNLDTNTHTHNNTNTGPHFANQSSIWVTLWAQPTILYLSFLSLSDCGFNIDLLQDLCQIVSSQSHLASCALTLTR